jgi:hypothetical protein
MDIESLKKEFLAMIEENKDRPLYPAVLDTSYLEDAFKTSQCDERGYAELCPVISSRYSHGETEDGIKILSLKSAVLASSLYTKYLDEEALVWDHAKEELYLYIPDGKCPKVAFKSMCWTCARQLTPEFRYLNMEEVYKKLKRLIKRDADIPSDEVLE